MGGPGDTFNCTPEEEWRKRDKEQRQLKFLIEEQERRAFNQMTGQQKYSFLLSQKVIKIEEDLCSVDAQALQDMSIHSVIKAKVFAEVFQYTTTFIRPFSSIEVALGDFSSGLGHQSIAEEVISALSETPNITSLKISCGTFAQKLNFTSVFSIPAATALATHGIHLANIVVSANTQGANEFAQSILILAEKGKLQTYQLTPISWEGWRSDNQINSCLTKANTAIKNKTAKYSEKEESDEYAANMSNSF